MSDEKGERFGEVGELLRNVLEDVQELRKEAEGIQSISDMEKLTPRRTGSVLREATESVRKEIQKTRKRQIERVQKRAEVLEKAANARREMAEKAADRRKKDVERVEEDKFVLTGRLVDEKTGEPLPDVKLRAVDMDRKYDDLVAETHTDELGYYRVVYDKNQFEDIDEKPEMYIEAVDDQGEVFYRSPTGFRHKSGKVEVINAAISAEKVPESKKRSQDVSKLTNVRKKELRLRNRSLRNLTDLKGYR